MDVRELQRHLRTLASLEESPAPVITCYLDLESGTATYRPLFEQRIHVLRKSLPTHALRDFEGAAADIEQWLAESSTPGVAGAAIFARRGTKPFFLALRFRVPLPTWISIGSTPNLYHLVELRDNYDRYIILLASERESRIMAINLGAVTEQIWSARPELRQRVGREWRKDHFQDHRTERNQRFIHDQVRVLKQLVNGDGYSHLVLAGNSQATAAVKRALPKSLTRKLVDVVPASASDRLSDIVASTLRTFLEHEEMESQAIAERLVGQIRAHGLAVAGAWPTFKALRSGQADYLVLAKAYDPGRGWECRRCGLVGTHGYGALLCPSCRAGLLHEIDIKAEMVRLAETSNCQIEVVEHGDVLMALGGVGCLLRYLAPESFAPVVTA